MGGREGRGAPSEGSGHVGNRTILCGDTEHSRGSFSLASGVGEVVGRLAVERDWEVVVTFDLSLKESLFEVVVKCLRMLPILSYTGSAQEQQLLILCSVQPADMGFTPGTRALSRRGMGGGEERVPSSEDFNSW